VTILQVVAAVAVQTSPVSKVVTMLKELQQKVIADGANEQREFDAYSSFCKTQATETQHTIRNGLAEQEDLEAIIDKANSDITKQSTKIEEHGAEVSSAEGDLKKATAERHQENQVFRGEEANLMDTINSLERASNLVRKHLAKGGSFLQASADNEGEMTEVLGALVASESVDTASKQQLMALVQQSEGEDEEGAPEASAYDDHDGTSVVLETLDNLAEKSQSSLAKLRDEETKARHSFEMVRLSLQDQMNAGNAEVKKAKNSKAVAEETKAQAQAALTKEEKDVAENKKVLKDLQHDCMEKAQEYETEMAEKNEELKALAQAEKIISSSTQEAAKEEYGLNQEDSDSFVQVKMHTHTKLRARAAQDLSASALDLATMFRQKGRQMNSRGLVFLASRISAAVTTGGDVFGKVKSMVREMIGKLEKEAADEADTKAYCDKEMGEAKIKQGDHEQGLEDLSARINKRKSAIAKLKEQLGDARQELIQIGEANQELSKMRQAAHEEFLKISKDYEEGLHGVQLAVKVLREYYAKSDDEDLMQTQEGSAAQQQGSGAGDSIISMLEVVESDFSKSLAELRSAEDEQQSAYEEEHADNKERLAVLESDIKGKEGRVKQLVTAVADAEEDQAGEQDELDAVNAYIKELEPKCISKPEPYEEAKKRREKEMAGLREGLEILEGNAIA